MRGGGGPSSPCGSTAEVVVSVANLLCRLDLGVPSVGSVSTAMCMYGERYTHVWVCGCEGKGWDVGRGGMGEGQRKQATSKSLTNGHRYTHCSTTITQSSDTDENSLLPSFYLGLPAAWGDHGDPFGGHARGTYQAWPAAWNDHGAPCGGHVRGRHGT